MHILPITLTAILALTNILHAEPLNDSICKGDAACIEGFGEEQTKSDCVDRETAKHLGHGSMELGRSIADYCVSVYLQRFHPETTLDMVRKAERQTPDGQFADLMGKTPGVGEAGDSGSTRFERSRTSTVITRTPAMAR